MEFVVGGNTLRARDQLGALASASSTTSRRGSGSGSVGGDVTVTTAATATTTATANATASATATATTTTTSTTTLATEGHVLARLVWDLVASTARSFVVTVDDWYETEKDECDTKSRCLCVRVSPLLLSIVGEVPG
ncbi:hypothetical protein Pelo_19721 [Pelomyxa schiedti]|nr:hypothetical protein Pelo_19721 [Pelomyxa schiedti]